MENGGRGVVVEVILIQGEVDEEAAFREGEQQGTGESAAVSSCLNHQSDSQYLHELIY